MSGMSWIRLNEEQVKRLWEEEGLIVLDSKMPAPDSHWRLRRCRLCKSDYLFYLKIRAGEQATWSVRCMNCGAMGPGRAVRHDAQLYWNEHMAAEPIIRRAI